MRPLVLLDAAPFCYGPASTLQAVIDHLLERSLQLVMLVSGTSAEFMRGYDQRCELVKCDTEDLGDLERLQDLFRRSSVFVSDTNPVSAKFAIAQQCKVVYLDTLFWMWDDIDDTIARSSVYVAQDFPGVEENRQRIGRGIRDFRVVKPLLARSPAEEPRAPHNTLIVSFGGLESKLTIPGTTNRYPWVMTGLLIDLFGRIPPFDRYLFRGGARVMRLLASEFKDSRFEFDFAPHHTFLSELRSARQCLLSPGLTGAYEALHLNTPTCLLLPQNYSQQLQAETFLRHSGWPFEGLEWRDLYPWVDLPRYLPEAEAIARLNDVIRRFENDAAAQRRYVAALAPIVPMRAPTRTAPVESGAEGVANLVLSLVSEVAAAQTAAAT